MAFSNYETDAERGQPVELVLFIYGKDSDGTTDLYYAYTTAEVPITHNDGVRGDITYDPLPGLARSNIKSSGKPDKEEVSITVPRTSEISQLFHPYPPTQRISVIIRQGHIANIDDPGGYATGEMFPVAWLGRCMESSRTGAMTEIGCESGTASMKRMGLRRHYQWACPWVLYSTRCGASKAAATVSTTVASFAGASITPAAMWLPVDKEYANFVGGMVEWQGTNGIEKRRILRIDSGDGEVHLAGPVRDLAVSDGVDIILGCPLTVDGCENLHDNIQNFGGCPGIPTFNPINKNNHS